MPAVHPNADESYTMLPPGSPRGWPGAPLEQKNDVAVEVAPAQEAAVKLRAFDWTNMIEQGAQAQKALSVAAGSRRVDVEMINEIRWFSTLIDCFYVVSGRRRLACPGGGVYQQLGRHVIPFATMAVVVLSTVVFTATFQAMYPGVDRFLFTISIVLLIAAIWQAMRIIREPAHHCVLELVELRARSHLKLSSHESNVGPNSLTFYTKALAVALAAFTVPVLIFSAVVVATADPIWLPAVPFMAWFFAASACVAISFQRWVANIGGATHWWRRQVVAIVSAEDVEDLPGKLQDLHALLRQPFVQINNYSTTIALAEVALLFNAAAHATAVLRPSFDSGSPIGSFQLLVLVVDVVMFFVVLFWCASVGDEFQRVRSLLNQPAVLVGLERHLMSTKHMHMPQSIFNYFQQLDFGFTLINVTVTTHRVLSLLVSVVVTFVIASDSLASAVRHVE